MKKGMLYLSATLVSFSMGILVFFIILIADSTLPVSQATLLLISIPLNIVFMLLMLAPIINVLRQLQTAIIAINQKKVSSNIDGLPFGLLADLIEPANTLIGNQREFLAARGRLYEQISEVAAQEERKRLARDLHDSIKQQVFSISISAAAAQAHLDNNPTAARAALTDVKQSAQEAMVEMRALLQQLAPAPLEKSGLIEALREQAEALSYRTGANVETKFGHLPQDDTLPIGTQEALFRMAQEALSNIARHARAKNIQLSLTTTDQQTVALHIIDDGQGFDIATVERGMGIGNIERRVAEIAGATLSLESAPQQGTQLHIAIPLYDVESDQVAAKEREDHLSKLYSKAMHRYWGFNIAFSLSLFTLSLALRVMIQETSILLFITAIIATVIAFPSAFWFLRQFQQHRRIFNTKAPPNHARRHLLKNRLHQGDWIIWFSVVFFIVPPLFLLPQAPLWLVTGIGLIATLVMFSHLILVAWERHQEIISLHPVSYDNVMSELRSSIIYGWITMGLLVLSFLSPNLLNVDVDPLLRLPISTEDQWQRLIFLAMIIMFAAYHAIVSWLYWHHRHHKTESEIIP